MLESSIKKISENDPQCQILSVSLNSVPYPLDLSYTDTLKLMETLHRLPPLRILSIKNSHALQTALQNQTLDPDEKELLLIQGQTHDPWYFHGYDIHQQRLNGLLCNIKFPFEWPPLNPKDYYSHTRDFKNDQTLLRSLKDPDLFKKENQHTHHALWIYFFAFRLGYVQSFLERKQPSEESKINELQKALSKNTHLQAIHLNSNDFSKLSSTDLKALFKGLLEQKTHHTLSLSHCHLDALDVSEFQKFNRFLKKKKNLRILDLSDNHFGKLFRQEDPLRIKLLQKFFMALSHQINLEALHLPGNTLGIVEIFNAESLILKKFFKFLSESPSLKRLNLQNNHLNLWKETDLYEFFAALKKKELQTLNPIAVQQKAIECVAHSTAIEHLDLSNNQLGNHPSCAALLASYLHGSKHLKHLNLSFNQLGKMDEISFENLIEALTHNSSLENVDLSFNDFDQSQLECLRLLSRFEKNLGVKINLSGNYGLWGNLEHTPLPLNQQPCLFAYLSTRDTEDFFKLPTEFNPSPSPHPVSQKVSL